jgi:hypothetical protein
MHACVYIYVYVCSSVRVEGRVERVSAAESDEYFSVRPRRSQVRPHHCPCIITRRFVNLLKIYYNVPSDRCLGERAEQGGGVSGSAGRIGGRMRGAVRGPFGAHTPARALGRVPPRAHAHRVLEGSLTLCSAMLEFAIVIFTMLLCCCRRDATAACTTAWSSNGPRQRTRPGR